jgi:hypothetical protein
MECLSGISSRHFLSLLAAGPVATMTTGITKHFMFHIRWISIHKFIYFNFFPLMFYIIIIIIIISIYGSAAFVGPWLLIQFSNPIHSQ